MWTQIFHNIVFIALLIATVGNLVNTYPNHEIQLKQKILAFMGWIMLIYLLSIHYV